MATPLNSRGADFLTGRLLVRNTLFNLAGEILAFAIGALCIPYVVRRLGTESFGILSLAWALLGYITLFDLGLSRATTKFVAEAVSTGNQRQIPDIVWTSVTFQLIFGIIVAFVCGQSAHVLAAKFLKVPPQLVNEATRGFVYLTIATPFVLVTNCLRGMLEALQNFPVINYIKVATNILMFGSPFFLIPFGGGLASVILLMTIVRFAAMLAYLVLCFSSLRTAGIFSFKPQVLKRLLNYGGWVTVSSFVGPMLMYSDRFAIGGLLSVAAVAYYTGPADMLNRVLVVPASLGSTLFPAFSSLEAAGAWERLQDLYARSLKYLIITMGPPLILIGAFSRDLLSFWLGPAFADRGAVPLQILAVGTLLSSLAILPYGLLQGAGKPRITAIFHVLELPLHLALLWIFVSRLGVTGAAIAVAIRILIDTVLILWACHYAGLASLKAVHHSGVTRSAIGLLPIAVAILLVPSSSQLMYRVVLAVLLCAAYWLIQWHWSFDRRDRDFLFSLTRKFGGPTGRLQNVLPEPYGLADPTKMSESD